MSEQARQTDLTAVVDNMNPLAQLLILDLRSVGTSLETYQTMTLKSLDKAPRRATIARTLFNILSIDEDSVIGPPIQFIGTKDSAGTLNPHARFVLNAKTYIAPPETTDSPLCLGTLEGLRLVDSMNYS